MIDPRELRIGNYVSVGGRQDAIEAVVDMIARKDGAAAIHCEGNGILNRPEQVFPIPITKAWLLKFGFEKRKFDFVITIDPKTKQQELLAIRLDGGAHIEGIQENLAFIPKEISYVHRLQNLHYALTGQELT